MGASINDLIQAFAEGLTYEEIIEAEIEAKAEVEEWIRKTKGDRNWNSYIEVKPVEDERKRCCCNCRHNIRSGEIANITCHCEIDGHYIGYVECFEGWCKRWAKDKRQEKGSDDE